jgi:general secretion pathway protein J
MTVSPGLSQSRARHLGFTLVEVMVALVLMAVVSGLAWQGLDAMMRTRDITRENVDRTLKLSRVIGQLEQDVAAMHSTSPGTGKSRLIPRPVAFDGSSLRIVRRTDDGLQIVVWALRDGVLQRWAGPSVVTGDALIEQWLSSLQLIGNEPRQLRLLEGVSSMQTFFFSGNAWGNAQSSLGSEDLARIPDAQNQPSTNAAPSSTQGQGANAPNPNPGPPQQPLPQGVRVVLVFDETATSGGVSGTLTRDMPVARQEL